MDNEKKGVIQQQLRKKDKESPLQKYGQVVAGKPGKRDLLRYEFCVSLVAPLPGPIGIWLRRFFLPFIFENFGRDVIMERDVSFRRAGQISIGSNVTIGCGVTLDVKTEAGRIRVGDNVSIGRNTIISCPGGTVTIEDGARIGKYCRLGSLKGLIIGKQCCLENFVCVVGAGHEFKSLKNPIIQQPLTCRGLTVIKDNVRIGRRTTLLDGVQIGSNVCIKPGSLVNKDVAAANIVGGVPAASC